MTAPDGWRRLSRRMLLVHPVQETVRAIPALLGLLVAGSSSGQGPLWSLVAVGILVALGTLRWFTTTYRITPDQVQVRRGLLRRRVTTVARDRVRTVDVTAHVMHRALGLARVTVGTGRSDRHEDGGIRLDALRAADAAALRTELLHRAAPAPESAAAAAEPAETVVAALRPGWVRYGPFTLSGFVTVGVIAAFLSRLLSEAHADPEDLGPFVHDVATAPLGWVIAAVVVATLLAVTIASTAGYVLAFWRFRLTRHPGGTLHVERGLITTRATSIEERRLHGAEVSEPLLLRAAGGARCIAIATGLRVGRGAERGGSLLLPPAPRAEAQRVAAAVLGAAEPVGVPLTSHGPRARRRRFSRALVPAALPPLALGLAGVPAWETSLVLLPAAALLAADRARSLGHALVAGHLVARTGSLVRRRSALACEGIVGVTLRRSFFQRRAGLATLTATTAAGRQRYAVQDVDAGAALGVARGAVPGLLDPFLVLGPTATRAAAPSPASR